MAEGRGTTGGPAGESLCGGGTRIRVGSGVWSLEGGNASAHEANLDGRGARGEPLAELLQKGWEGVGRVDRTLPIENPEFGGEKNMKRS